MRGRSAGQERFEQRSKAGSCWSWFKDAWHLQHWRPHCTPKKPLASRYFLHRISDHKAKDAKSICLRPRKARYFLNFPRIPGE